MTSEEHNKYLAYSHIGYASLHLLMTLAMSVFFFLFMMLALSNDPQGGPPAVLFAVMIVFMLGFQLLFTVPSLIAGFGLLKRRDWARTASIIAGVLAAMSFPIGTAVCVYTFWFLLGEAGKYLYAQPSAKSVERPASLLNEPVTTGETRTWSESKREYVPPKEMPNWRD